MNEIKNSKAAAGTSDYVNPLAAMDIHNPPVDWTRGEYPAIDDIWSWLHLSMIHEHWYGKTDRIPLVPEIVFAFRIDMFAKICYNRQFLQASGFFKHYGTTDIQVVAQEEWLYYLRLLVEQSGSDDIRSVFAASDRSFKTRSHADPGIRKTIELLRPSPAEPAIFVNETRNRSAECKSEESPGRENQKTPARYYTNNDFQTSKTLNESLLSASQLQQAVTDKGSRRTPLDFNYQEISSAVLPEEGEEDVMGSGVSCGLIGEGGMAKVYKVRVEDLEMIRAGKVLIPGRICETEEQALNLVARYRDEAKVTAQLHHSNVVLVHLFGKFRGLPYIEMEYVNGSDLRKLIQKRGKSPLELFSAISILGLRGLAYAHSQSITLHGQEHHGVMHRDIKPANLLIDLKKGNVKLTDFGLARPPAVSIHTMAANTMGTLGYMSPEQLESNDVDIRTDIYSFGATMYEILAGTPLFPQTNFMDLMKARQANAYQPLAALRKNIPRDIVHIIDGCTKYNANERTQSAETLMDYLEDAHLKISKEKPEAILQDYVLGKRYYDLQDGLPHGKKSLLGHFFKR